VVRRFKEDPTIAVFLSSDAGSHGLSFQEARYVVQYEPTYSYDLFVQRSERINRADSYLDGLTNYVYVTDDSVEQRIWAICNERKEISAATQGTNERFSSRGDEPERPDELSWLIFGE
jgi:superfamily II DNA/RNA helicase